jgi:hypothetical protein
VDKFCRPARNGHRGRRVTNRKSRRKARSVSDTLDPLFRRTETSSMKDPIDELRKRIYFWPTVLLTNTVKRAKAGEISRLCIILEVATRYQCLS